MTPPNLPNPKPILDLANAFFGSCVLFVASDTGIFKRLAEKDTLDAATLAQDLNCSPRGLQTPSRCLCGRGPSNKDRPRLQQRPRNTCLSCAGKPRRSFDSYPLQPRYLWGMGRTSGIAKTGKPVERPELHLGEDQQRTRTFVMSMHGRAMGIGRGVVPLLDLAGRKKLLDVGGGPGTYSVLISQAFPEIDCIVLDLPEVVKVAQELIERQGAASRVSVLSGDYHTTPFPGEFDAVNFFGMLHQESPAGIGTLARKLRCAQARVPSTCHGHDD